MGGGKHKKDEKKDRQSKNVISQEVRGVIGQKDNPIYDRDCRANAALSQLPTSEHSPVRKTLPNSLNLAQTYFSEPNRNPYASSPLSSPARSPVNSIPGDSARNSLTRHESSSGKLKSNHINVG